MRDDIIKKNLIITISSLLLFFLFSFFAISYSIRNSFEKEVVSVSQMVETQLNNDEKDGTEIINSFTYNQSWLRLIYATNSGLIIQDSQNDIVDGTLRLDEKTLSLLNNIETKDRIYIQDNIIYYITSLENKNILITGIEIASIGVFIYKGVFFMLLIFISPLILSPKTKNLCTQKIHRFIFHNFSVFNH